MLDGVQGKSWTKKVNPKTGERHVSDDETERDARSAEKALLASVKQGINNPGEVVKSISPTFADNYPGIVQMVQNAATAKNFTTASPLTTGLVPFDLENPSRLLYWFETPLRNKIPRLPGKGTSHRTKLITSISGSPNSNAALDISTAEITSFSSWPAALPTAGTQVAEDLIVPHRFLGLSESLSWVAQFAGEGFEDITALTQLVLMHEMHLAEEAMIIAGTTHALTAPTVSTAARTAGSSETALTGFTTDIYVKVTSANVYGETAGGTAHTQAVSSGQVVDVTINVPANQAAQFYNVYVSTGGSDPGDASRFQMVSQLGGTKVTLQGALPTAGPTSPTADTGTAGTGRIEGVLSVVSGNSTLGGGSAIYPAGQLGGYVNTNVQQQLNLNVINTALQQLYNGSTSSYRANPDEIIVDGRDAENLSIDVAKNLSGTAYQLIIEQDQMGGVVHGTAVSQVVNPVTRKRVDIMVHPGWPQGTALINSNSTPMAARNSSVWEMRMVQELMSIAWPVIDPTYRFSMFEYGSLVGQAPQFCGLLGGLQASVSGTTFS